MGKSYTSSININGRDHVIESTVSEEEIKQKAVVDFNAYKAAKAVAEPMQRLGAYLNIAKACEEANRCVDVSGIFNRSRRLLRTNHQMIDGLLDSSLQALGHQFAHLPTDWQVIHAWQDLDQFNQLINHQGALYCNYLHPGAAWGGVAGRPGLMHTEAEHGLQNASFHVIVKGQWIATVPLVVNAQNMMGGVINHPAMGCIPAEICFTEDQFRTQDNTKLILSHLYFVARAFGADVILLAEPLREQLCIAPSFVSQVRYSTELWSRPWVDLTVEVETIYSNLRKSYKSQINWGRKNLHCEYFSGSDITDAEIVRFYDVLGQLNSQVYAKYGNGMNKELFLFPVLSCRQGEGEVAIAKTSDGQIVGMTVSTDLNGVSYYALGGYAKQDNKSAGHFMLFDAIARSKQRGNKQYVLNRQFPSPESLHQSTDIRNRNIMFFKSGFSNQTRYWVSYRIHVTTLPFEV